MNINLGAKSVLSSIVIVLVSTACSSSYESVSQSQVAPESQVAKEPKICDSYEGYHLYNGQIITMDKEQSMASSLIIKNNRIASLGSLASNKDHKACLQHIDLKGRTVIPGLIDSHVHYVRAGSAPGIDLRSAETAFSISQLQALIREQTKMLDKDQAITVIGGITAQQFEENRFPTLEELDEAAGAHVFYAQQGFSGPAFTNSAGIDFFTWKGVAVAEDGTIEAGKTTASAFVALKSMQTHEDRKNGLKRLQQYANSLGLTTIADEGGVPFPGAGFFDTSNDYAAMLDLWSENELTVRIRSQRLSYDRDEQPGNVESYLSNAWSGFGDDFLKNTAMGEHIVSFPRKGKVNPAYASKVDQIASKGWSHEQHSTSFKENQQHLAAIEKAHLENSIAHLRWSLAHVFELGHNGDLDLINRLKSMNMGLRVQNHGYSVVTDRFPLGRSLGGANSGPLYRTLAKSGIRLGAGSDGPLLGPINPWLSIYYMLSGKNSAGQIVNKGETIDRLQALELYTRGNAWFTFDEENLGSLEVGKIADLVVLSGDYLKIALPEIRTLKSVLTMVDGKIVYRDSDM